MAKFPEKLPGIHKRIEGKLRVQNSDEGGYLVATVAQEALKDTKEGGLLLEVLVPRQGRALPREDTRNPGVLSYALHEHKFKNKSADTNLIGPVPDGDTNAGGNILASLNDGPIVLLLLLELLLSGRQLHADIKLSDSNLNTEAGELAEVLLDCCGNAAYDEMALYTNTVDGDMLFLERLHEVVHAIGFSAEAFDVVIVDLASPNDVFMSWRTMEQEGSLT